MPRIAQEHRHDPLRLEIRVRLQIRGVAAVRPEVREVVVAPQDEVDVFPRRLCQGAVLRGELVRQGQDHLALVLLPQLPRLFQ